MFWCTPLRSIVNTSLFFSNTSWGLSYLGAKVPMWPSRLTRTDLASKMVDFTWLCALSPPCHRFPENVWDFIARHKSWLNEVYSVICSPGSTNCPESAGCCPVTNTLGETPGFRFGAALKPSKTPGNSCTQVFLEWSLARRAFLRDRCHLSSLPLCWGWYAVVGSLLMPIKLHKDIHSCNTNWDSRSEVMMSGTPNWGIHSRISILAQTEEDAASPDDDR